MKTNVLGWVAKVVAVTVLGCLCAPAGALDVDFDSLILRLDAYLSTTQTGVVLRDRDNDSNGIKEGDQLGMLSAILLNDSNVSCINATTRNTLINAYNTNFTQVPNELVVNISGVGTVNIVSQLNTADAGLGDALQQLLAGYMTIADTSTITFVNTLADSLIAGFLDGTPQEGDTQSVQNQITFTGADFQCHGGAVGETDYIGPRGDIDNDSSSNVAEYADGAVIKTREEWLISNCISPRLRLTNFTGGGQRISGLKETFRVETAGANGAVTYSWRKGTTTSFTVVGTSQDLVINFLTSSSAGKYFCVVSDGVSTRTTHAASLTVTTVPIFFATQPAGATRNPGSNYTFSVSVQGGVGSGPYTYQWKKASTNVGTNAPTLTLTNLTTADAGTYRVTVTSNGGGDTITSSNATLNVRQVNFSLTSQPQGAKKYVGDSHTLSVTASGGSGSFSYTWKRNGSTFGAPSQASITLNNLTIGNAGNYTCTVTDTNQPSNTADTDVAVVEVANPLLITQQPVGGMVQTGSLIQLSVTATGGFSPLSYQWRWQGIPITGQTFSIYSAVALAGFEGNFTCRVTDANGTQVTSDPAPITLAPEIFIDLQPTGAKKYTSQSHTFFVSASGGQAPLTYQWYKDSVSLGTSAQGASLALSPLSPSQSGLYVCRVTDGIGSFKETEAVELKVADVPIITQQPQSVTLGAGDPLQLNVTVTGGMPPLTYQWRKNNSPLLGTNSPTFSKTSVTTVDSADYTCRITDGLGTVLTTSVATVLVAQPIVINEQPGGGIVAEGSSFTFQVDVSGGVGLLVYTWLKEGQVLGAPSQPTLTLEGVTKENAGTYSCRISDESNSPVTTLDAVLTVVEPLRIDAQPVGDTYIEGGTVSLSITLGGGLPEYEYQWYKDTTLISGATEAILEINDATLAVTGLYRCEVRDQLGAALSSEEVPVLVVPEIKVTLHPKGADVYTGGQHVLQVSATGGNGDYTYIWRRNAEPIEGAPDAPQFTLTNLQPDDTGFYDCVVTESQGGAAVSFPAYLRIRDTLTAVTQPEGKFLPVGESHTLFFEVAGGFEPVRFQWLRNGEFVGGATEPELTLAATTTAINGEYECLAYDSVSAIIVSDAVDVSVIEPLEIISGPEGGNREPGESFTFTVLATGGAGTLHYEWHRNEVLLDVPDLPTLTLEDLKVSDGGLYFCVVTDEVGNLVTSPEALLQVSSVPIDFGQHPVAGERYPGESFTFSVTATGGVGDLSYQWLRNTGHGYVDIPEATDATLLLENIEETDAGIYRCRIVDDSGQVVISFAAALTVTQRLSIVTQPQPQNAYFGNTVSLSVEVTGGIGTKTYAWFQDGKPIANNSPTLTLSDVQSEDAGAYNCIVTALRDNEFSETVDVKLGSPLTITSAPVSVSRFAGESYVFNVNTTGGVGALQYQWLKNDAPVRSVKSFALSGLTVEDAGQYSVVVADAVGAVGGEVLVTLEVSGTEGELPSPIHSADTDSNGTFDLTELMRIIQFYNAGAYYCDDTQLDGYHPGVSATAPLDCPFHSSDFEERDRIISLSELLRAVQFFRVGAYWYCPSEETEDWYCPGEVPGVEGALE